MCALYIQSSGGIKNSTICARKTRTSRIRRRSFAPAPQTRPRDATNPPPASAAPGHPARAPESFDRPDQQARRKNAAHSRGISFLPRLQVGLLGKKIQIEQRRHRTGHAFARDDPLLRVPSTVAATRQFSSETRRTIEMLSLTVVVFPTSPSSVTTGMSLSMRSCFSAIDRHRPPPGRGIARHDFRRHELEDRAFAIGERTPQTDSLRAPHRAGPGWSP